MLVAVEYHVVSTVNTPAGKIVAIATKVDGRTVAVDTYYVPHDDDPPDGGIAELPLAA